MKQMVIIDDPVKHLKACAAHDMQRVADAEREASEYEQQALEKRDVAQRHRVSASAFEAAAKALDAITPSPGAAMPHQPLKRADW